MRSKVNLHLYTLNIGRLNGGAVIKTRVMGCISIKLHNQAWFVVIIGYYGGCYPPYQFPSLLNRLDVGITKTGVSFVKGLVILVLT